MPELRAVGVTPEYASPEQIRGEAVTTASDVYSLGVVLYELLTGRSPYRFTSRSPLDVVREISDTEPPRPIAAVASASSRWSTGWKPVPQLRGDLDNIVLMALRKEPERRYASVEQLSDDIRRHLAGRTIHARKDTFGYRAGNFIAHSPQTSKRGSSLRIVTLCEGTFDLPNPPIEALSFFPLLRKEILRDNRVPAVEVSASY